MAKLLYLRNKLSALLLPELSIIIQDYIVDKPFIVNEYMRSCIEGNTDNMKVLLDKYPLPIEQKWCQKNDINQYMTQIAFIHGNFGICELPYFNGYEYTTYNTNGIEDKHIEWIIKQGLTPKRLLEMTISAFRNCQVTLYKRLLKEVNDKSIHNLTHCFDTTITINRYSELLYILDNFPHITTFIMDKASSRPPLLENDPYSLLYVAKDTDVVSKYLLAEYYGLSISICSVCSNIFPGINKFCKEHGGDFEDRLLKHLNTKTGEIKMTSIHFSIKAPYNVLLDLIQSTLDKHEYFYVGTKSQSDNILNKDMQYIKTVFAVYCNTEDCKVNFLNEKVAAEKWKDGSLVIITSEGITQGFILDTTLEIFICVGKANGDKIQKLTSKDQFVISLHQIEYRYREMID